MTLNNINIGWTQASPEDIHRRQEEQRAFMRWLELYIPFGTTELTEEQLNTIFDEAEKGDFDIWYNKDTGMITVMQGEECEDD